MTVKASNGIGCLALSSGSTLFKIYVDGTLGSSQQIEILRSKVKLDSGTLENDVTLEGSLDNLLWIENHVQTLKESHHLCRRDKIQVIKRQPDKGYVQVKISGNAKGRDWHHSIKGESLRTAR